MAAKTGVLLLNIGSPRSYEVPDVKRYLKHFLMDKEVINLPFILRWPLVNLLIVPKRGPISAGNYKKIWLENGSPLTVYTIDFAEKLQKNLGENYLVKVGMRYSSPDIPTALKEFAAAGIQNVLLSPMYPQYADATTGSSLREVQRQIKKLNLKFNVKSIRDFYQHPSFVDPTVEIAKEYLHGKDVVHYLFSFHGLPESHVKVNAGCLATPDCCVKPNACDKPCYRAQCLATATSIAGKLGLSKDQWSLSYQSRLGRDEWLKPSTEETIAKLGDKKSIAVLCPSFVADCIETLEEIGIGGEETFHHAGGRDYHLVPCVNVNSKWVNQFARLIESQV
ncbi:ferrochelatase [Bdellovibrio sp. HCB290]|uniref:ferrochelatase n=1 Tax=Bdellovibrio sp. HCB290 TaxID=3394356 RepID=UPI0039B4E8D9